MPTVWTHIPPEEEARIKAAARDENVSVSTYIRDRTTGAGFQTGLLLARLWFLEQHLKDLAARRDRIAAQYEQEIATFDAQLAQGRDEVARLAKAAEESHAKRGARAHARRSRAEHAPAAVAFLAVAPSGVKLGAAELGILALGLGILAAIVLRIHQKRRGPGAPFLPWEPKKLTAPRAPADAATPDASSEATAREERAARNAREVRLKFIRDNKTIRNFLQDYLDEPDGLERMRRSLEEGPFSATEDRLEAFREMTHTSDLEAIQEPARDAYLRAGRGEKVKKEDLAPRRVRIHLMAFTDEQRQRLPPALLMEVLSEGVRDHVRLHIDAFPATNGNGAPPPYTRGNGKGGVRQ